VEFGEIRDALSGIPFISERNARYVYDFVLDNDVFDVLELGIAHGTATCYMAAAMRKRGCGRIVAVDLEGVSYSPSAEEQVSKFGFGDIVEIHRMKTGYNWFLHQEISKNTLNDICSPVFDLCIIDGPKNWTIDSSAFFLADKLLKKNGWMIFDDYSWTYGSAALKRDATDGIAHRDLSDEELHIPHVREIFELLVKQHPDYGRFIVREEDDWAIAQKNMAHEKLYSVQYSRSLGDVALGYMKAAKRRVAAARTAH
jgi:predicted O-methyltransferase YrrM